jgi:hypothetical protein
LSRSRIGALCMLFTVPFLLGSMAGAELCVCDSGIHFETLHASLCRAECRGAGCDNAHICGHTHSCTDIALNTLAPVFSAGVSGKRIAEKPQCQDQAYSFSRQDAILTRSWRAADRTAPTDTVQPAFQQSSILQI